MPHGSFLQHDFFQQVHLKSRKRVQVSVTHPPVERTPVLTRNFRM